MENISENMKTLSEVMAILAKRGVTKEFRMNESNQMMLDGSEKIYNSQDLEIAKTYRFEGDSNPADNAVLILLKATDGNIGYIIDSYGAESNYSGEEFDDFLRRIPEGEDPEYNLD